MRSLADIVGSLPVLRPARPLLTTVTALGLVLGSAFGWALQVTDLQAPQSFLADPNGGGYFISNANGEPDGRDNNGFITKLDTDGKVTNPQFIRGGDGRTVLHAPKGLAIVGKTLYVADLDAVRGFDVETGNPVITVAFPANARGTATTAPSLADLAHDGHGVLYASDPAANAIYRIDTTKQHAVSVLVRDDRLAGPKGLALHPKTGLLIAVSFNKGMIHAIAPDGTITELVSNSILTGRFRNLDGVDFDTWGNMYVSDPTAGKIWRIRPDQRFDVIAEFLPSPGDIAVDRKNHLILVPYQYSNAAEMNGLEAPVKGDKKKRTLADYGFGKPREGAKGK